MLLGDGPPPLREGGGRGGFEWCDDDNSGWRKLPVKLPGPPPRADIEAEGGSGGCCCCCDRPASS